MTSNSASQGSLPTAAGTPQPVGVWTPLGILRLLVRIPLFALATGSVYSMWLLSRPLLLVHRPTATRLHFVLVRLWARLCCLILGLRVRSEGAAPQAPYFLVANHLSYVDILVMFTRMEGYFLAKSEVASWPVMGWLASTTGTLFVDRSRKTDLKRVVKMVLDRMDQGHGVIVFPEGTSTSGDAVQTFKPSLFEVAVRTQRPVRAAALHYRTPEGAPPARLSVCWWGDMGFGSHALCLLTLPSIEATLRFSDALLEGEDRKQLAARAQAEVQGLLEGEAPARLRA